MRTQLPRRLHTTSPTLSGVELIRDGRVEALGFASVCVEIFGPVSAASQSRISQSRLASSIEILFGKQTHCDLVATIRRKATQKVTFNLRVSTKHCENVTLKVNCPSEG
jgi:hypothetical protein